MQVFFLVEGAGIRKSTFQLKPIFHWKLGLCWLPNANEIKTKNMKCTWPVGPIAQRIERPYPHSRGVGLTGPWLFLPL